MASKIIRIGNSRGVRIPRPLLEQAGVEGKVRLRVVDAGLLIEPQEVARQEWSEAAELMQERGADGSQVVRRLGRLRSATLETVLAALREMFED